MSKWKNVNTYMEVNPYTGQPIDEDMPTNAAGRGAVAGIGVGPDGEPGYDPKRKKRKRTLIDARSKSYRQHRERLEKARLKREQKKSKLAQKVAENTKEFEREKYIELDEAKSKKYVVNIKLATGGKASKTVLAKNEDDAESIVINKFNLNQDQILSVHLASKKEEVELDEVKISSYIVGELRDIVKNKSAKNLKFKDGQLKVDMTTANMMLQVLDKVKTATKRKIMDVLDSGKKNDFMKVHGLVMKAVR